MLVEQRNYEYHLTPLGQVLSGRIIDFVSTIGSIRRHKDFWAAHDLTGLPQEFLFDIGNLLMQNSFTIQLKTYPCLYPLSEILKDASFIHGAASMMAPGMGEEVFKRVVDGIPIELIVNKEAAGALKMEPYAPLDQLHEYRNFKIYVAQVPFKVGLTVTDKCVSLGLYKGRKDV